VYRRAPTVPVAVGARRVRSGPRVSAAWRKWPGRAMGRPVPARVRWSVGIRGPPPIRTRTPMRH